MEKLGGFKRVLTELYKLIICTSEGYDCFQKRFDGILFSSLLHVISKGHVQGRGNRGCCFFLWATVNCCE